MNVVYFRLRNPAGVSTVVKLRGMEMGFAVLLRLSLWGVAGCSAIASFKARYVLLYTPLLLPTSENDEKYFFLPPT